jgi:Ca-activated chloride channel family protein
MRLRLLISISLLALALQKVCAQSADDFFHGGAQAYLTNNTEFAKDQVAKGLKLYPDDIKLKKLDELLKQQQQQQQNQQNQQNQEQQQQQQKQDQQKQSQSKQDQQKQKSEEQKQKEEQKKQEQQKQPQPKPGQDKQDEKPQPKDQPGKPGQMTPEEAKRLLDAQKGDELPLPSNNKDKNNRDHPLKDW